MTNYTRAIAFLILVHGLTACGHSPVAPAPPGSPPPPPPIRAAPLVTAISPALGSTRGGTEIEITGTGFLAGDGGVVVSFGGSTVGGRSDSRTVGYKLYLDTPAHDAGTVDVVVINPDGQVATVPGGYTYAPPQAFDFNGAWEGSSIDGSDQWVTFTIRNDALISLTCTNALGQTSGTVAVSPPSPVRDGEFSTTGIVEGVDISGRIVGEGSALGTIKLAPCTATTWRTARTEGAR